MSARIDAHITSEGSYSFVLFGSEGGKSPSSKKGPAPAEFVPNTAASAATATAASAVFASASSGGDLLLGGGSPKTREIQPCDWENVKKWGYRFTATACLGAIIGLSILISKTGFEVSGSSSVDNSVEKLAGLALGIGALFQVLLHSTVPEEHKKAINSFCASWGFEYFEILTQISLNRDEFSNPQVVKQVVYALIATQAGNSFMMDFFEVIEHVQCCNKSEEGTELAPFEKAIAHIDDDVVQVLRNMEDTGCISNKKRHYLIMFLATLAIIIKEAAYKDADDLDTTVNISACLIGNALGELAAMKLFRWRQAHIEQEISENGGATPSRRRPQSRSLRCANFMADAAHFINIALIGVALPFTNQVGLPPSVALATMFAVSGGSSSVLYEKFINLDFKWQKDPKDSEHEIIVPETCWGKTCRKVREYFNCGASIGFADCCVNPFKVVGRIWTNWGPQTTKLLALGAAFYWFINGAASADVDTAGKVGISLMLASYLAGFGVTQLTDIHFHPEELRRWFRLLYFYLIQNPEVFLIIFIYLKDLNIQVGKGAYTSESTSIVADLGMMSLAFVAGNNRARESGSLGERHFTRSILKVVLIYTVFNMFMGKLT